MADVEQNLEEQVASEPVSLRDDLRHAVDQLKDKAAPESDIAKVASSEDERVRKENGQFAKADKERKTITMPAKPAGQVAEGVTQPVAAATPAVEKVPEGWTAELKAQFPTLPPAVKAEILRREDEAHKIATRADEDRTFGKRVRETANPYLATITAEGATVDAAWKDYLNTAHILRGNDPVMKARAIATVMQNFRVDPNHLISVLQGGNVNSGVPLQHQAGPQFGAFQSEIAALKQQVTALTQTREAEEQAMLHGEIDSFSKADGHEHFESVKAMMGHLLDSGQAESLQDAYDKAIWATPDIRSRLLEAKTAKAQQDLQATQKASAAKWAAGSVTGGPGGAKPNGKANGADRSLAEELRANLREATGRIS